MTGFRIGVPGGLAAITAAALTAYYLKRRDRREDYCRARRASLIGHNTRRGAP